MVTALYDAVQILLRKSRNSDGLPTPFDLYLYVYKEYDELSEKEKKQNKVQCNRGHCRQTFPFHGKPPWIAIG